MAGENKEPIEGVNPLAVDVIEPAGEVAVKGKESLTQAEIASYARRTGKPIIRIQNLQRSAVMGELSERLGGVRIGSSMLLESEEMITSGIKTCDELIDLYRGDPESVAHLVRARHGFVDLWVKVAHTHIKSKKDSGPDIALQPPQNVPFPPSVPVQVNVQTNVSRDGEVTTKVEGQS